ncbi:hypothetical protein ACWDUL_21070 [Nocardia niigatensis]
MVEGFNILKYRREYSDRYQIDRPGPAGSVLAICGSQGAGSNRLHHLPGLRHELDKAINADDHAAFAAVADGFATAGMTGVAADLRTRGLAGTRELHAALDALAESTTANVQHATARASNPLKLNLKARP